MKRAATMRRGFAMPVAIVLMGLVVIALANLTVTLKLDATRTRLARQDAQLRQLLLAGQTLAKQQVGQLAPGSAIDAALPSALSQDGASLRLSLEPNASPQEKSIMVEAKLPSRRAWQRLTYVRDGADWRLTGATLGE